MRVGFKGGWRQLLLSVPVDPSQGSRDMVGLHLALISALGVPLRVREPFIERTAKRQLEPPLIVIHPGGHYPSQRWSAKNFAQLGRKILELYRVELIVIAGVSERRLIEEIMSAMEGLPVETAYPDMKGLVSILSRCSVFVCNNSGPLHMAAALGTPSVSTMGPTDPVRFWPRGGHAVVVSSKDGRVESIMADDMLAAFQKIMKDEYGIA